MTPEGLKRLAVDVFEQLAPRCQSMHIATQDGIADALERIVSIMESRR